MIDLILRVNNYDGKVIEKIENINDKEIINHINNLVNGKDGSLFIEFEEYE